MEYLHMRIVELLKENEISKTKICKDLDLQRGNFNRYCRENGGRKCSSPQSVTKNKRIGNTGSAAFRMYQGMWRCLLGTGLCPSFPSSVLSLLFFHYNTETSSLPKLFPRQCSSRPSCLGVRRHLGTVKEF